MRDFFNSNGFKLIVAAALIAFGLMFYSFSTGTSMIASVIGFVTTPMQHFSNVITDSVNEALPSSEKTVAQLQEENAALQEKLNQMIALTVDYYDIKRENEQNVKYLELKERKKDYKFASAAVIGRDPMDLFYGFTLDQGSLVGISKYDPVITDKGLVGWVSAVYPTYCKVTTILSPDTDVSVIDQVSRDSGIVTGSIEYADNGFVKMKFISAQNSIQPGDIVITSGIGGMYPGELPLGEVLEISQEESNIEINAVINPYEDIRNVRNVFVITEFLGQGDTMPDDINVYTSGG